MKNRKNSKNQSTNNTVIIYGDNTSPQVIGFSCILSVWIIAVNALVVLCLTKKHRRLIKSTFAFQIVTLSISDLFVGPSTLPIYVTGFMSQVGYEICLFGFVFLLSAQGVEQFQIFGICVNCLSVVCQLTSPLRIPQNKKAVLTSNSVQFVQWQTILDIYWIARKRKWLMRRRRQTANIPNPTHISRQNSQHMAAADIRYEMHTTRHTHPKPSHLN